MVLRKLTITFTPEEREALDLLARQDTRQAKDQVRVLIRTEAERRGLWPARPETQRAREAAVHYAA